jgi:single-strand DNA-binding protein
MSSNNKVILIGNLGADPERRTTASGDVIWTLRLATAEKWKDKASGEMREGAEWHRVVLFRRFADLAAQHLRKGASVYIEGRLRTRKWQDREGRDRYMTEVEASDLRIMNQRGASPQAADCAAAGFKLDPRKTQAPITNQCSPLDASDIPF